LFLKKAENPSCLSLLWQQTTDNKQFHAREKTQGDDSDNYNKTTVYYVVHHRLRAIRDDDKVDDYFVTAVCVHVVAMFVGEK